MTICFKGTACKYEIEAVMKLFIPVETFDFLYEEIFSDGDNAVISAENSGDKICLSCDVFYSGKRCVKSREIALGDDPELPLCQLLYKCMNEITGIVPEWGCITGIRPVKKVNALLDKGLSKSEIFADIKEKYYTSDNKLELAYLTAVTQRDALKTLKNNSYSLYIAIPFCPSRCSYCSFVSHSIETPNAKKLIPQYVDKLCEELEITAKIAHETGLFLDTIYIGGGTPTSLSAEQLEKIMKTVKKFFDISKIREYTVEAGRCDTITPEKLAVIKENGGDRISINPQTMNADVLKAIGRRHSPEAVVKAFEQARSAGFDNINMDTIAGLPTDTPDSFKSTMEQLIFLDPEEITVHTLTLKRAANLFRDDQLVCDENIAEMVDFSAKRLTAAGYLPYYLYRQKNTLKNLENVGYAKAGKEGLYNIYIMEEAQTIIACGASASTKLFNPKTGKIERIFNYKYPYEYISRFDTMCGKKADIKRFFQEGSL